MNDETLTNMGLVRNVDTADDLADGHGHHPIGTDDALLMPPKGRFKNAGILLPTELWTFTNPEHSLTRIPSSLRAILEDGAAGKRGRS
jgi:hypothetical protein